MQFELLEGDTWERLKVIHTNKQRMDIYISTKNDEPFAAQSGTQVRAIAKCLVSRSLCQTYGKPHCTLKLGEIVFRHTSNPRDGVAGRFHDTSWMERSAERRSKTNNIRLTIVGNPGDPAGQGFHFQTTGGSKLDKAVV